MSVYGPRWREKYEAQRTAYANILTCDLWERWEADNEPESRAGRELWNGLVVLWGGDEATARRYFERAMEVCERAAKEKPYLRPEADADPASMDAYPRNRALMARARAHLRGLLRRERAHELAMRDFRDAAADYAEWCTDYSAGTWGETGQAYTLDAVRLSLLAGDRDCAAEILKTRRRFKLHAEEHALLLDLSKGDLNPQAQARLEALLDRLRNPDVVNEVLRDLDLVRLELALLLDRLFLAPEAELDWLRAAARVAR